MSLRNQPTREEIESMSIIDIIKEQEGCKLKPYTDTTGHITIGYGRNLSDCGISQDEAEQMLLNDVETIKLLLSKSLNWYASKPEYVRNALVSMAFNVGVAGLLKFVRFLNALENNKIPEAIEALKFNSDGTKTKYYTQVPSRVESICKMLIGKI